MAFLNEHAFQTPTALIDPDILDRLESHGSADRILAGQRSLLRMLLSTDPAEPDERARRPDARGAYRPTDLITDLHDGDLVRARKRSDRDRPLPPQPPARLCRPARRRPSIARPPTATCPPWPAPSWSGLSKEVKCASFERGKHQPDRPGSPGRHQDPRRASAGPDSLGTRPATAARRAAGPPRRRRCP